MAEVLDGSRLVEVVHANPVSARGFVQIPMVVVERRDVGPIAKLVYGYLSHLAWKGNGTPVATTREQISEALDVSAKQVTTAMRELAAAPSCPDDEESAPLVRSRRRGRGQPNQYVVSDPQSRKAESAFLERPNPPFSARASAGASKQDGKYLSLTSVKDECKSKTRSKATSALVVKDEHGPPKIKLVDGRNLPLDALCETCGIDPDSPRMGEAVAALNGGHRWEGIRYLFWREATRYAEAHGLEEEFAKVEADPAAFEAALAHRIRVKADLYREAMDEPPPSAGALRKWWLDVEQRASRRREKGGVGMTPDEIRAMPEDA